MIIIGNRKNMTAIQIENLSKQYILGNIGSGTFWRDMNVWWASMRGKPNPYQKIGQINDRTQKAEGNYVWALRDINLSIEEGEVVGIIGSNGAGKSTLLKILSRVTAPTTGRITTYGRIASLLEVGTGFHQEMTGRENIYMNGAIMGMTRNEISQKLDEIIDFAGVAKYIDTPVKRYSSGMTVRLGFAVAAFLEPEILVVDEVLAVGDAEFQQKAIGKMKDVSQGEGRTVLFVSHNMAAVRNLCKSAIVLQHGAISFTGTVSDAIDYYTSNRPEESKEQIIDSVVIKHNCITVSNIKINGTSSSRSTISSDQEFLEIEIAGHTTEKIKAGVKLILRNSSGTPVAIYMEGRYSWKIKETPKGDFLLSRRIILPQYLAKGTLTIDLILHQPYTRDFFVAEGCVTITCDGKFDPYCNPIYLDSEGILGLESI